MTPVIPTGAFVTSPLDRTEHTSIMISCGKAYITLASSVFSVPTSEFKLWQLLKETPSNASSLFLPSSKTFLQDAQLHWGDLPPPKKNSTKFWFEALPNPLDVEYWSVRISLSMHVCRTRRGWCHCAKTATKRKKETLSFLKLMKNQG